jgi:hypothetical protein
MEIEAIRERILPTYQQELSYLAEELKRVQTILRERDYGYVNTGPTLLVPEPPALAYRQKMSSASACQTTQPTPTRTCNPDLRRRSLSGEAPCSVPMRGLTDPENRGFNITRPANRIKPNKTE